MQSDSFIVRKQEVISANKGKPISLSSARPYLEAQSSHRMREKVNPDVETSLPMEAKRSARKKLQYDEEKTKTGIAGENIFVYTRKMPAEEIFTICYAG